MEAKQFGDVLREARERSGEDIVSVARRIRIRPDILERIEASDLDGMPPRGYARNMINAYARYLGLNPTELVKMYLDAQYQNQVEKARSSARPSGFDMSTGSHRHNRNHNHNSNQTPYTSRDSVTQRDSSTFTRSNRPQDDDAFFNGRSPSATPPAATTRRIGSVHVGSFNAYGQGLSQRQATHAADDTQVMEPTRSKSRSNRSVHQARTSSLPEGHYGNLYAAPSNLGGNTKSSSMRSKLPFIIAAVLILLLVVLIVLAVNGMNRAATTESSDQPMNITGMPGSESTVEDESASDDTSEEEEEEEEAEVETAPTETVLAYEVADGEEPYVEIKVDGDYVLAETITGPASDSFDITGTFQIVASPYEGLTVTQDGEEIDIDDYVNDNGIFIYSVDFQDVLDAWNEEHDSSSSESDSDSSSE